MKMQTSGAMRREIAKLHLRTLKIEFETFRRTCERRDAITTGRNCLVRSSLHVLFPPAKARGV